MANPYYKSTEEYLEEWGNRNTSSGKSVEEYRTNYQNALSAAVQKGEEKRQQSQVQTPVLDASKAAAAERAKKREEKRQAAGVALPSSAVIPGKNNAVMTPGGNNSVPDTVGTFQNIKNEKTGTSGTSGMPSHAPFVSEDAKRENLTTNYQLREPTGAPIAENVQRDMASNMAWLTLSDEERAKRIAEYNDEQIVQQAEIVNKQYDEKMTAYNQANAAYDEWLKKNQSDEVINAMSADYDAPEWVAFRAEGERLYAEAKKYDDEADALRLQADSLHDQALFIQDMRRINELLPKMDEETRAALDAYAEGNHGYGLNTNYKQYYALMAKLGVSEGEARRLAETWKRNKNKEGMEAFEEGVAKYTKAIPGVTHAIANLQSVSANVVAPFTGFLAASFAGLSDGRYRSADPNGALFAPTAFADTVRQTTASDIAGENGNIIRQGVADIYNGAMGAADNVLRTVMYGEKGTVVMAMDVFQRTVRNASKMGATKEQALALGLASAGLEYATEQVSTKQILDIMDAAKKAAKEAAKDAVGDVAEEVAKKAASKTFVGFLKETGKLAGKNYIEELPQELISFWGNAAAEAVILGQNSDFNKSVRNYMTEQGMTQEEAEAAAWKDLLWDGSLRVAWDTWWSTLFQTGFATGVKKVMDKMAEDSAEGAPPTTTPPTTPPVTQQKATEAVQGEKAAQEAQTPTAEQKAQQLLQGLPGQQETQSAQQQAQEGAETSALPQLPQTQEQAQTQEQEQAAPQQMTPADEAALKLAQLTETKDYPGMETKTEAVADMQEQMPQRNDFAMGAADRNFSGLEAYNDVLTDDDVQPDRATDARFDEVPKTDAQGRNVSQVAKNIIGSPSVGENIVKVTKQEVMNGTFSFETQSMEGAVDQAIDRINKEGAIAVEKDIFKNIEEGKQSEHDVAAAAVLFTQYANSRDIDSQHRAGEMLSALSAMSMSAGRQLNMFKLLRKLTPEGQLYTVKRNITQAVDQANKRRKKGKEVQVNTPSGMEDAYRKAAIDAASEERSMEAYTAAAIEAAVSDGLSVAADKAIDSAVVFGENVAPAQQEGLQTNDMTERVGKRVADTLNKKAEKADLSVEDVLFREIMAFAEDKADAGKETQKPKESKKLETLRDYYRYRAFFQTAWDNARTRVQQIMNTMSDDDPRLERLRSFLSSGVENTSPLMRSFDYGNAKSTLRAGTKEAAQKAGYKMSNAKEQTNAVREQMRDVLTENWQSKQEAAAKIAEVAMEGLDLTQEQADEMATNVMNAFYADLADRAASRVANMFDKKADRNHVKKTLAQKLAELYNLGAFSNEEYRQAAFDSVFGEDSNIDIPDHLLQQFADAAEESRAAAEDAIYKNAASQIPATLKEKYDAWRYMAMLGNARTQVRNVLGNVAFKGFVDAKQAVGAAIERAFLPQEQRTKSVLVGKNARALLDWAKADAKAEATRQSMEHSAKNGDRALSRVEELRKVYNTKVLELARKGLKDLMSWEDMLSKKATYSTALAGFLNARGITAEQLYNGTVDEAVLAEGRAYAVNEAMKATFNDDSDLANVLTKLRNKNPQNKVEKFINYLVEGNFPYLKTPANIVARAYEYSPVAGVETLISDTGKVKRGEMSAAEYIDKMSASLVGTGVMAIGMLLGSGIGGIKLIGGEPTEEEKQNGFKAWQLVVGDVGIPIDWIAPYAIPLLAGANLARMDVDGDGSLVSAGVNALLACATAFEPMLELSMLSSFNEVLSAGKYAESGQEFYSVLAAALTSNIRQAVPTLFGHFERATEQQKTQTYAEAEQPVVRSVEKFLGDLSKSIPGVDLYQIESLDSWGDKTENRSQVARSVEDLFFPFSHTERKTDPAKQEYLQVTGRDLGDIDKNISYTKSDGTKVERRLAGEEYNGIKTDRGTEMKKLINELTEDPIYQNMSQAEKAKVMEIAKDYATEKAKVNNLEGFTYGSKWMAEATENDIVDTILAKAYASVTGGSKFSENKHGEMVGAGIPDAKAKDVQSAVGGLTAEEGYSSVRTIQQLEAIMDVSGLTDAQQTAALKAYMTDEQDAKMDKLTGAGYGLTVDQFVNTYRAYIDRENAEDGKKDIAAALGVKVSNPLVEKVWKAYQGK